MRNTGPRPGALGGGAGYSGENLTMTIQVGDRVPSAAFRVKTDEGIKEISTDELFKGKKVVLFSVPGAFTPTCSAKHLPGFVQKAAEFKAKGVDTIACMAVNRSEEHTSELQSLMRI